MIAPSEWFPAGGIPVTEEELARIREETLEERRRKGFGEIKRVAGHHGHVHVPLPPDPVEDEPHLPAAAR